MDEEDAKEFTMRGKPYKEKYNGERLSKIDYNSKYADYADKISLNFHNVSVDEHGLVVLNKNQKLGKRGRLQSKNVNYESLQSRLDMDRNLLAPNSRQKGRHRKYTSQALMTSNDYTMDMNSARSKSPKDSDISKLPDITEHVPHASRMLEVQLPKKFDRKHFQTMINSSKSSLHIQDKSRETASNLLINRNRKLLVKSIHDKFHKAIKFDQNWGKSAKIATDMFGQNNRK